MSDLRTRIAAALGDCYDKYGVDDYNLMADAVIRELGLEAERRVGPGEPGEGLSGFVRYVTGWAVDE